MMVTKFKRAAYLDAKKVFSFSYQASQCTLLTSTWKGRNQNQITNSFLRQLHYQIYKMLNKFEYVKPAAADFREKITYMEKTQSQIFHPLLDGNFLLGDDLLSFLFVTFA